MKYRYSYKTEADDVALAHVRNENASFKHSVMLSNFVRDKKAEDAIKDLEAVSELKKAVPFTRYNRDVAHKRGMSAGRYPVKASKVFIKLIKNAMANAKDKNLGEDLKIVHVCAKKGATVNRYGRHRGRATKVVNVEIALKPLEN